MFARAANEDPTVQAAIATVVFHKVDCEKGEGIEVAKRFNVRGYPTFKMVDGNGAELERWIGYDGPEVWAALVAAGVADPRTLEAKAEAYKTEPTAVLARSLGNAAATTYDWKGAVDYFKAAAALDPADEAEYEESILSYTYYGSRGDDAAFGLDDVEGVARKAFDREGQTPQGKLMIASMVTSVARDEGKPERAVPYLKDAMAAAEGSTDPELERPRSRLAVDYALLVEKDADKAVALKKAGQPEGWQDDAGRLNGFAWWCFENNVNLAEAQEMALKAVDLAADDQERAEVLDTLAEICHALGNCDDAVAHMKRAIELQPDNGRYKEQLARFEAAREAKKG
ncbi:MAG TPA: tetratricopeptide repeat protein [Candidatus Krumholzibacteria bacterium]|nr:tetratricopeptide repeat protein [Candidatus Krumholzibacteria bacterium]